MSLAIQSKHLSTASRPPVEPVETDAEFAQTVCDATLLTDDPWELQLCLAAARDLDNEEGRKLTEVIKAKLRRIRLFQGRKL